MAYVTLFVTLIFGAQVQARVWRHLDHAAPEQSVLVTVDGEKERRIDEAFRRKVRALDDEVVLCTCAKAPHPTYDENFNLQAPFVGALGYVALSPPIEGEGADYVAAGCKVTAKSGASAWCFDYVTIK